MLGTTSSPSPPPTTNKGAPGGEAAPMAEEGSSKEGCSGCGCGCGGGDDDCWPLAVLVLMEMVGRRVRGSMENFMPPPNDARLLRLLLLLLLLLPAGDASSPPLGTATVLLPLLLPSRERLMPASRFSLLPPCSCPRARCRLVLRGRADDVWTCCCCDCSGEAEADEEEAAAAAAAGAGGEEAEAAPVAEETEEAALLVLRWCLGERPRPGRGLAVRGCCCLVGSGAPLVLVMETMLACSARSSDRICCMRSGW